MSQFTLEVVKEESNIEGQVEYFQGLFSVMARNREEAIKQAEAKGYDVIG